MGIASKYNKGSQFTFKVPKEFKYCSLVDLYNNNGEGCVYEVKALFINKKSRYGDSGIVALSSCLVNLPQHLTDSVKEMLKDEELIEAVNNGKVGMEIYPYETEAREGLCFSVRWVDC